MKSSRATMSLAAESAVPAASGAVPEVIATAATTAPSLNVTPANDRPLFEDWTGCEWSNFPVASK
jgi:hypothetical protein